MTDSVVAEGQVKLRDGKKWKSRWLVLRKPSPVADCLLMLVFKDKSEKSKGHKERSSVTLEDICGLEPGLSLEGVNHILAIICLGQTVLLAFENKETMSVWDMRTRYSLGEVHRFHVSVLPGTKLESGPAALHFCNNIFVLVRDVPPTIIGQWKLSDMRRYGAIPNGFVFEGGSRCGLWAGVFCLSCAEGERISFLFDCIVRGISTTKGPFGLRPALPDPSMSPAYMEEKISHEALELEKRLSLLSQSSRQSSGGDDRSLSSSTESSDASQSDSASMGSRLTLWPEQLVAGGLQEGHPLGAPARGLGPAEEKLYAEVMRGSKPPPKPPRSRKLQEVGRQSSSDSGIATASHSSYSGSFSSYAGSLDVCQSDEFGSLLSLPSNLPGERALCTCEPPATPGSGYQVPSSLRHHYDTPRSVLQAAALKEVPPVAPPPSALKDQAPAPPGVAESRLLGTERGQSFPSVLEGAGDPAAELYADVLPRWTPLKPQGQLPEAGGSEAASIAGAPMPGVGLTDPCEMCGPYPGVGRALFTACLTCGGLKGTTATQSGSLSISADPGSGSESKETACINKLYGLTEPRNSQYKELQRTVRNTGWTKAKPQGGNWHKSDGDIYDTLWETSSRRPKGTGACQLGVTGTRWPAPRGDFSAEGNPFGRSRSMDDRLHAVSGRRPVISDELGAHRGTFARPQRSGGRLSHTEGHRGGNDGTAPAERDAYETMAATQHSKSGRRDAANSSRGHRPIQDLWRKLESLRDAYNAGNAPRKLLAAMGKARTFPGTGAAQPSSPTLVAQPYVFLQAPVRELCVPEGCRADGDFWRCKAKDVGSGKSSTWSPGRPQANTERSWKVHQLSHWTGGIKELAPGNGSGLKAEVCERAEVDEDKKPSKKEEKLKMVTGQMYEFMEALPTEKQSELEKGSGYEYMASCGQQKLLPEGEGAPGSLKLHRGQGAHLETVGLKHKKEKGFPEDESSGSFDTKKLSGGAFAYPLELPGTERSRPTEGATYVNIPVSPTSKMQLHYMELELQESSPAIRGASSSKYAQIDITATETAHKVGTQHAQHREERLQELEQKRKGAAPQ
ncbi:uncharacterized protein dok7b [Carcharodon carcharias]|uniref:uncharacterized protein dok7b n=1 Tax=Carcharodon carcharias TaxID=13397 RepID=UPI001B7DC1AB|nr:uncharacterized protein dok7b [Carcharodon carcharias]